ncbi:MAG: chalcone isomerase family protein [Opitutales bacterium]|nr:chalcone isomerase family protein [Opitutales bacterium]
MVAGIRYTVIPLACILAAVTAYGDGFKPVVEEDGVRFERKAEGTFRWRGIFRVYDGALYLENGGDKRAAMNGEAPLRLELHYSRGFSASDIVEGGNALLEKNVDRETLTRISDRLEKINTAYQDISSGDRYSLTFIPDKGTTLRLNGEPLVTVEGGDFAAAYFRIWLGDDPISTSFRDQLLGR